MPRHPAREFDRIGYVFTTRPVLSGTYGMVATTHWLATAAGMAVLEAGGTAADAAAAAGFALQVVEPHLNGPGGDLPLHGRQGRRPRPAGALRAGHRAGRGHRRPAARRAGAAPRAGHRAAGRHRAGRVRGLAGAVAGRTAGCRCATSCPTRSGTRPTATRCIRGSPAPIASVAPLFRDALADLGRALAAGTRPGRSGCASRRWRRRTSGCWPRRRRPAPTAEAQLEAARAGLVRGVRRRGDRRVLGRGVDGRLRAGRTPACSPAPTWPAGGRAGSRR